MIITEFIEALEKAASKYLFKPRILVLIYSMLIINSIKPLIKNAPLIKSKIAQWLNKPKSLNRVTLYFILFAIVITISHIIFSYFGFMHTDVDSARYMLSALIQSEAAIVALVVTLSLIAVQLAASSYSARVIEVFRRTPDLWILMGIYGIAIFYGLGVLKLIEKVNPAVNSLSNLEGHIAFSYYLGVFAFVALVPYILNILNLLNPSTVIDMISERIIKQNILDAVKIDKKNFNQPIIDMGKDPIQPIVDIIRGSLMKYDYETVRDGLKAIEERTKYMFSNENFNEMEEKNTSQLIFAHLSRVGKLASSKQDEDAIMEIANTLYECGEVVIKKRLEKATDYIVVYLGDLGKASIEENFETAELIITMLGMIGMDAAEYELESPTSLAATNFGQIGKIAAEYGLENSIDSAMFNLLVIGKKSAENKLEKAALYTVLAFGETGKVTAKHKFENATYRIVDNLREVLEVIAKQDFQKFKNTTSMAIISLEMIGIVASENNLKNVTLKIAESLNEVIKISKENKLVDELNQAEKSLININKLLINS